MAISIGEAVITLGLDKKPFEQGLQGVTNKFTSFTKNMGTKMSSFGKQMSMKLTLPLIALGTAAFKMAGDFDTSMRKVNVMLKASAEDFAVYKKQVLDISTDLAIGADQVADSFYQIVSAGYRGADAIDILRVAMEGAKGGAADALLTTQALTKAMNIFQLEGVEGATRAMDVFFGIVDTGLLTFEQMAAAFPRAATMAAGLGVSIEEVGAALGTLTKVSGSTEQASTALNAVFTQLIKPSVDLQNLYEEWGVTTGPEAIEKFGGLEGVLNKVQEATGGNVAELSQLFPNVEAIRAILPLVTTNASDFASALDTVSNSTGRTGEALSEMTQGPGFQWQQMMVTLKNGMIELGGTISGVLGPWIEKLINWMKDAVAWFGNLPGPIKNIIIGVGLLVAALGPLLFIGGALVTSLGKIVTAGKAMVLFIYRSAIPALIRLASGFIATLASMGPVGWGMIIAGGLVATAGIAALKNLLGGGGTLQPYPTPEGMGKPPIRDVPQLASYQHGGPIDEPTLLYGLRSMKPYAIAGDRGPERVSPAGASIEQNFNIASLVVREEADVRRIAKELFNLEQRGRRSVGLSG